MKRPPLSLGDSLTIDVRKPHVTAVCPCGGEFTAGESTDGVPFAIHSLPTCPKFVELGVAEFMRWARLHGARTLS